MTPGPTDDGASARTPLDLGPAADLVPSVAETHSGVVFFFGDRAYKVKKPIDLGFLDFRTRAAREAVCHREVELNRRLAPDVYLGVSDVTGADGEVCEHLVVMRRMPTDRRLSRLVAEGHDVGGQIDALAELLARFHAGAERGPEIDRAAGADALSGRWTANTRELQPFVGRTFDAHDVEAVESMAQRYLAGRRPLFAQRIAEGRARDGHGDLLADDIFCLDDGPRVLDCLEFDDALRFDDVLADVAFLAMDLEHLGRADLADRLLATYRRAADDPWPASLAHHHIAYRAQVRAKVSAIRADQSAAASGADRDDHGHAAARSLLALARRHLELGRVRLVLVGGLPGTGKSTLAAGLGQALGATVLRTDVVRKELAGIDATEPTAHGYGEGLYDAGSRNRTYRTVLERARDLVGTGQTVVLDASWNQADHRDAARRVGAETSTDVVELRCVLDPAEAEHRIEQRARRGGDASDADAAIARSMAAAADPWPEATPVDAAEPPERVVAVALEVVRAATGATSAE